MSGSSRSGRNPKPIELHAIHGTYRPGRHGPKPEQFEPIGPMPKPKLSSPEAGAVFTRLAKQLKPVLRSTDAESLAMLCEMLVLYRKSLAIAAADPTSKTAARQFWDMPPHSTAWPASSV